MSHKWQYLYGMETQNPYDGPFGTRCVRIPNVPTASLPTPNTTNEGSIVYDSTLNALYYCDGAAWQAVSITAGVGTLQQVTTAGKTSNVTAIKFTGASSNANRLEIGDGTRMLALYGDGTDLQAVVPAGDFVLTAADDIKLVPTGGDVSVTGNVDMSGDLSVTGSSTIGTLTAGTSFAAGTDGSGVDASFYSTTAGDLFLWDASERTLLGTDTKIHMGDSDSIQFGAGSATGTGDWYVESNGTDITIKANANIPNQKFAVGDATNEVDFVWNSTTTGAEVTFDSDAMLTVWDGVDIKINDEDYLLFGDDSDWTISYADGDKNLTILAGANVADQAIVVGNATNEVDILWYGTTSGDLIKFDSSDDSVLFTDIDLKIAETGAECALDVSSAATGADGTVLKGTAALTDGFAVCGVKGTGNIAAGGAVLNLDYGTGTPDTDARVFEIAATGKDLRGIFVDADSATNDMAIFNCGGNLGSGKSVLHLAGDGTVNAGANVLFVDASNATFATNAPIAAYVTTASAAVAALKLENTATNALGCVLTLQHNPAAEADNDVACRIQFIGSDAAHADESAGRIDVVMRDETAANPDFDMLFYIDVAGTETLRLELPYDMNGIDVGSGAAANYINGTGAQSLVIQNNRGTNSPIITLANGAAASLVMSVPTTGTFELANTDTGAVGSVLIMSHHPSDNSEANSDVIGRVVFEGQDDANADENYARIDCMITDVTAANPDADLLFYVDRAGTLTQQLQLDSDINGVIVGDGAAGAIVSSSGAQDLTLETNSGTNSGTIVITDAANGNITVDPNGTGRVAVVGAALANGTAHTNIPQIVCMPYAAASFDANDDLVLFNANSPKIKVIDVWVDNDTAEGLAATLTVRDTAAGGGNVIATAIDINATTLLHAGSLTTASLAANSSVFAHASVNPGTCVGTVYVMFIEVA